MRLVRNVISFLSALTHRLDGLARGFWALPFLFLGSVIESFILPWPIEFPMLAYMLRGRRHVVVVTITVVFGSALGAFLAYLVGSAALASIEGFIAVRPELAGQIGRAQDRVAEFGGPAVALAMMSPVPVQITSFAAGLARLPAEVFLGAVVIGRTFRYAAMAIPVYFFGERIMGWWSQRPAAFRVTVKLAVYVVFGVLMVLAVTTLLNLAA